jgi:predicted Zn finger-like uncharacterized protein
VRPNIDPGVVSFDDRGTQLTIEFHCPHCNKALRTSDDKAGRLVKCPHCGETTTVPQGPPDTADSFLQNEYLEGATFEPRSSPTPTPIFVDAGEIISTSWAIFKSQMGMLIAALLIVGVLVGIPSALSNFIGNGLRNNLFPRDVVPILAIVYFVLLLFGWILQIFLTVGQTIFFLKIARGQPAELGDLFRGGHFLLRAIGSSLLVGLMIGVGFVLLIVPAIILALMFWPFLYVLVDADPPGMGCISRAREITRNTWGSVFLLWLTTVGLLFLGALACCVGLLFTIPLSTLLFAVAYCRMTGQPTANV